MTASATRAPGDGPLDTTAAPATSGTVVSLIQRSAAAVVLACVIVLGVILFGTSFASTANFSNLAVASSFLGIVAIGMTFVIISGGIDLSVGSMYALAAVLAAYGSQWGSFVGIVLPIAVCGTIGFLQGTLIGRLAMPPFIVTLGRAAVRPRAGVQGVRRRQHDAPHRRGPVDDEPRPGTAARHRRPGVDRAGVVRRRRSCCSTGPDSVRRCSPSAAPRTQPS